MLGAVGWLRHTHPLQSAKIFGIGIDTGGAALIGAAADPGVDGQAIKAIAVYGCFHDLPALARKLANDEFLPPFNWLFGRVGLAIADLQTGADLTGFSPARESQSLWPRPIFIVSGSDDHAFPMEMGRELYEAAPQPKRARWVNGATTTDLLSDPGTTDAVSAFFKTAQPLPVI